MYIHKYNIHRNEDYKSKEKFNVVELPEIYCQNGLK